MQYFNIKNLSGNYIKDVSLCINEGTTISILGINPEELIETYNIIFDFIKPKKGAIFIKDIDVNNHSKVIKRITSGFPAEIWYDENMRVKDVITKNAYNNIKTSSFCKFNYNDKLVKLNSIERRYVYFIKAINKDPDILIINYLHRNFDEDFRNYISVCLEERKLKNKTNFLITNSQELAQKHSNTLYYLINGKIRYKEYVDESLRVDKILTIYDQSIDIDELVSIGGVVIGKRPIEIFYNGKLTSLTHTIYKMNIDNYTLENADLKDKMKFLEV